MYFVHVLKKCDNLGNLLHSFLVMRTELWRIKKDDMKKELLVNKYPKTYRKFFYLSGERRD